ncbi:MAG TPA: crosslink repair DNA glycosylase YcaQ family protein, partial [Spirochaetales bacterium]|nr:crosslink repair DNA glycosylase YcaQ family protein [Spirochaetales bacterium]
LDLRVPSPAEHARWHLDRTALAHGVFSKEEAAYLRRDGVEGMVDAIAGSVGEGRLIQVRIEGLEGRKYYATRETLSAGAAPRARHPSDHGSTAPRAAWRAEVLSPFDPCLIDRKRLARLFGEDYTLECYVPAAKRVFGYFALPVMAQAPDGDGFICGKADCKLVRAEGLLKVLRLQLRRPAFAADAEPEPLAEAAADAFSRFASGLGAKRIEIERFDEVDKPLRAAAIRTFARSGIGMAGH